ncbi:unnamed protein product [Ambrosiozyma monospora]|uniref:Unnamed protein product n=1 Tax=Ambrosiozyma monospora TaxID=43982 RepID=A0ACB5SX90_AMBMO|nr:unnamed protein product [Ambrosiozyma monospora]
MDWIHMGMLKDMGTQGFHERKTSQGGGSVSGGFRSRSSSAAVANENGYGSENGTSVTKTRSTKEYRMLYYYLLTKYQRVNKENVKLELLENQLNKILRYHELRNGMLVDLLKFLDNQGQFHLQEDTDLERLTKLQATLGKSEPIVDNLAKLLKAEKVPPPEDPNSDSTVAQVTLAKAKAKAAAGAKRKRAAMVAAAAAAAAAAANGADANGSNAPATTTSTSTNNRSAAYYRHQQQLLQEATQDHDVDVASQCIPETSALLDSKLTVRKQLSESYYVLQSNPVNLICDKECLSVISTVKKNKFYNHEVKQYSDYKRRKVCDDVPSNGSGLGSDKDGLDGSVSPDRGMSPDVAATDDESDLNIKTKTKSSKAKTTRKRKKSTGPADKKKVTKATKGSKSSKLKFVNLAAGDQPQQKKQKGKSKQKSKSKQHVDHTDEDEDKKSVTPGADGLKDAGNENETETEVEVDDEEVVNGVGVVDAAVA